MRIAPVVTVSAEQRVVLELYARGRRIGARLVERARIILLAAEGKGDSEIAELLSIPRQKAARWRERFLVKVLARISHRASSKKPLLLA